MDEKKLIRNVTYSLLTLLVSGNLFFVKRLVDKLEVIEERVWQLRQEVVILSMRVDSKIKKQEK